MAAAESWQRQPGESAEAFEAFKLYRDLPPGTRSYVRVVSKLGKSRTLIQRWQSKHDWVGRVEEWDVYQDKIGLEAQLHAVQGMNRRHVQMSMSLQTKALRRLEALDPSELTPAQLLAYLLEATRLERLARGEPKKIEESREKIERPSDIDYDEVARRAGPALRRLIERGALGRSDLTALEGGKGTSSS